MNNIGIIGVGKLGLPYALAFEHNGFNVVASSYKKDYVDNLNRKIYVSYEPEVAEMLNTARNIRFTIDNNDVIANCDIMYVMVATPSTSKGDYDTTAVTAVAQDLLQHDGDVSNKIMIVGSTVNPGDCDSLQEILSGRNVHVVYAPTFVAQGTILRDIGNPQTLSIGTDNAEVAERCKKLFSAIIHEPTPIYVMQRKTAEILKMAGNCRSVAMISFINMIGQILIKAGLRTDMEVANQYLHFVKEQAHYTYGFGYGGPCYPRDNMAFASFAEKLDMNYTLGYVIDDFNKMHADFVVTDLIEQNRGKDPFYFSYLSYKNKVALFDESQPLRICEKLLSMGHKVLIEDTPFVTEEIRLALIGAYPDMIDFIRLQDLNTAVYTVN